MNHNQISSPLVSVIMPVYNAEKYVSEAIQGILQQTYANFEFIIINDASTDNSKKIIQQFDDKRIIYIENKEQKGVAYSMNLGMEIAKGKYIARMDADDIVFPERFMKQVNFLEKNIDIDIVGTFFRYSNEKRINPMPVDADNLKVIFIFYQGILNPSVMMRAESIKKNNLKCNETFTYASDYDFFISAQIKGLKFYNIPNCLMVYRLHANQISSAHIARQDDFANAVRKRYYQFLWKNDLSENEMDSLSRLRDYTTLSLNEYTNILAKIISINQKKKEFIQSLLIKHCVLMALKYCDKQQYKNVFDKIKAAYKNPFIKKYATKKQKQNFAQNLLFIYAKQVVKRVLGIKP